MNEHAKNLTKPLGFSAISSLNLERLDRINVSVEGGRANLKEEGTEQPGGLAYRSALGVSKLDPSAGLGLGGLVGAAERESVLGLLRHLGADTVALQAVSGTSISRRQLLLPPSGKMLTVRRTNGPHWAKDVTPAGRRQLLSLVARSKACLLGGLPSGLSADLLDFGRRMNTFMAVAADAKHLARLSVPAPHALFVSPAQARLATGLPAAPPAKVFAGLLGLAGGAGVVVMTGGRDEATFVAHRASGGRWAVGPACVSCGSAHKVKRRGSGAGDFLAGVATFLLGASRGAPTDQAVVAAVRLGREVALAHACGDAGLLRAARARYRQGGLHGDATGTEGAEAA